MSFYQNTNTGNSINENKDDGGKMERGNLARRSSSAVPASLFSMDDADSGISRATTMMNSNSNHYNSMLMRDIYEEIRSMTKDTRLIPIPVNQIGVIRTHDILGIGTFSTVTRVAIVSERNRRQQQQRQLYSHDQQQQQQQQQLPVEQQQQYYACKSVKDEFACTGDRLGYINAVAQLAYEAHVLSSLNHPNIIKIRGISANGLDALFVGNQNGYYHTENDTTMKGGGVLGNFGNGFFLLMDVLHETLDQRIDRWRMDLQQSSSTDDNETYTTFLYRQHIDKYNVCLQLSSALDYLHQHNIVYRDLKPQNIGFAVSDGSLQLFDFGLCRELTPSQRKATGIIGTMRYMAPEVCLDQEYDCDCDIYSFVIVCWELWTHCLPYETLTPNLYQDWVCKRGYRPDYQQDRKQLPNQQQHPIADVIPDEVLLLISQAWTHNPSSRIRWSTIQGQLTLFKQLEELRLEERELFMAVKGLRDDNETNMAMMIEEPYQY